MKEAPVGEHILWGQKMDSDLHGLAARTSSQTEKIVGIAVRTDDAPATMKLECGDASFVKHDAGKPRLSLIPADAEREVAVALTFGAQEYGPTNWHNTPAWSRYYDAARRHMNAWEQGEDIDAGCNTNHLANAIANLYITLACQKRGIGTDDRDKCC